MKHQQLCPFQILLYASFTAAVWDFCFITVSLCPPNWLLTLRRTIQLWYQSTEIYHRRKETCFLPIDINCLMIQPYKCKSSHWDKCNQIVSRCDSKSTFCSGQVRWEPFQPQISLWQTVVRGNSEGQKSRQPRNILHSVLLSHSRFQFFLRKRHPVCVPFPQCCLLAFVFYLYANLLCFLCLPAL